jgi:hypothetical protein
MNSMDRYRSSAGARLPRTPDRTSLHLVGLAAAVSLASCDCGGGEGDSAGRRCETTAECAVGETCRDRVCVPDPSTRELGVDGDSDGSAVDAGGGAVDGGGDGEDGGPADGGVGAACTTSFDCAEGLRCEGRVCVPDERPDGGGPTACTVPPVPAAFESPVRELHWRGTGRPFPDYEQALVSPVVVDFLPDGPGDMVPEIVFVSYRAFNAPGVLRVVSGRPPHDTRLTLTGDGRLPGDPMAMPSLLFDGHPAAGDLDGDGQVEIVALLQAGGIVAFRRDGSEMWSTPVPRAELTPNAAIALADLEGDGTVEVVAGRVVLEGATGAVRWTGSGGRGINGQGPLGCVADLDDDGQLEVIAGRTVYRADGRVFWETSAGGDGFCAVADLLDAAGMPGRDGRPEIVRVASGTVYVHDGRTGMVLRTRAIPACGGAVGNGGAPTVADFDGDGRMEIGVAAATCYSVFDFECTGAGTPAGCAGNGLLWRMPVDDTSSNVTSSTVFDFNGDGTAEVVYNDEQYFMVFDGPTGRLLFRDPNPSRTRTEQPVVADVDNDGNAEIVFCANNEASFAGDMIPREHRTPGVEVWSSGDDSWVGARTIWNQHSYHIDNVTADGRIPRSEAPSWMTHNTYRLNADVGDALLAPNLGATAGSFDESNCGAGTLRVCAQVSNRGDVRVGPGITVRFYDGRPEAGGRMIGEARTTRTLEPRGAGERVCVDWAGAPTEATREVWVRVDAEDVERECIEDDNTVSLGSGRCTPFG